MYLWAGESGDPGPGEITGPDIGSIAGRGQPAALSINQIDAAGWNNGYFEVAVGDTLLVRQNDRSGYHELTITGREGIGDYAIIEYAVEDLHRDLGARHRGLGGAAARDR